MKLKQLYAIGETHRYTEKPENTTQVSNVSIPKVDQNPVHSQDISPIDINEIKEIIGFQRSQSLMTENIYQERREKISKFLQKYKPRIFFDEGVPKDPILDEIYDGEIVQLDEKIEEYTQIQALNVILFKKMIELGEKGLSGQVIDKKETYSLLKVAEYIDKQEQDLQKKREKKWAEIIISHYKEPSAVKCGYLHLSSGLVNCLKLLYYFPKDMFFYLLFDKKSIFIKELKSSEIKVTIKEILS